MQIYAYLHTGCTPECSQRTKSGGDDAYVDYTSALLGPEVVRSKIALT